MKRFLLLGVSLLVAGTVAYGRQPREGYRGFIDWNNSVRNDTYGEYSGNTLYIYDETNYMLGLSTSHGYQINPMFYVGAGVGLERCLSEDSWIAPIFVDGRVDMKFGKLTPFGDLRVGVNVADGIGAYISPMIGYRINWGRKTGLNIGAGVTFAGHSVEHFEVIDDPAGKFDLIYTGTKHRFRTYFSFRIGFDF